MFRYALPLALPVSLALLLTACGHEEPVQATVRPAMVVQPEPSAQALDSYPGEVRARYEPDLAFRIGGKVSRRLVDEGQRVKANQALATANEAKSIAMDTNEKLSRMFKKSMYK